MLVGRRRVGGTVVDGTDLVWKAFEVMLAWREWGAKDKCRDVLLSVSVTCILWLISCCRSHLALQDTEAALKDIHDRIVDALVLVDDMVSMHTGDQIDR